MHAKYEGNIIVTQGGAALGVPNGTSKPLDTTWFKADILYLSNLESVLVGFGFRYLDYKKPETTSRFHVTSTDDSGMSSGNLLSGTVLDTEFKSYNLIFGIWDPSYIGIPTNSYFFYDVAAFIGFANIKNEIVNQSDAWSGGLEGNLGLKYSVNLTKNVGLTARFGVRFLYCKMTGQEKIDETKEEFIVTETMDYWYGPFASLNIFF